MNFWKVLQVAMGIGSMVRGARKQLEDEGLPVPDLLEKAAGKAEQLEIVLAAGGDAMNDYDRFLDRTQEMGAGLRIHRVLADGTLDEEAVDLPPLVANLLDKAMDAIRKDPVAPTPDLP